jgi:hypothetical protein
VLAFPRWIQAQVREIAADPALRSYGVLLALAHTLCFAHWKQQWDLDQVIGRDALAICWGFFEACGRFRVLDAAGIDALLYGYAALSLATALLFALGPRLGPRAGGWAWAALLVLELLKASIVFQDFRLRLNQHYMHGMASLAFLFVPRKREVVRVLIALFYFWAGALKLNREWLSGAALYKADAFWIQGPLLPWACAYVIVLEMGVVFGLFARRPLVFWSALAQFALFHVFSWPVVGFYYPILMFLLLALYPLCRFLPAAQPDVSLADLVRGRMQRPTAWVALGFSALQLAPMAIPGDSALTGEGRIFAVHMFDARLVCEADYAVTSRDGSVRHLVPSVAYAPRIRCDPLLHWNLARNLCLALAQDPSYARLDLRLASRRSDERELRRVLDVADFCRQDLGYRTLWHNDWIRLDGEVVAAAP